LFEYEHQQKHPAFRELALKLALSDQLGTQVTSQLISLATALRGEGITEFRKLGAKKETYLLMPLVFLVLPITVLFALVPSVQFLQFSSI
jgi:tight adherence protein C